MSPLLTMLNTIPRVFEDIIGYSIYQYNCYCKLNKSFIHYASLFQSTCTQKINNLPKFYLLAYFEHDMPGHDLYLSHISKDSWTISFNPRHQLSYTSSVTSFTHVQILPQSHLHQWLGDV